MWELYLLPFEPVRRMTRLLPDGEPTGATIVRSNDEWLASQFTLGRYEPVPAAARFNFEVDDVDAWWARVGPTADVVEELFDTPYGSRKRRRRGRRACP
jgi:hypothetical protein